MGFQFPRVLDMPDIQILCVILLSALVFHLTPTLILWSLQQSLLILFNLLTLLKGLFETCKWHFVRLLLFRSVSMWWSPETCFSREMLKFFPELYRSKFFCWIMIHVIFTSVIAIQLKNSHQIQDTILSNLIGTDFRSYLLIRILEVLNKTLVFVSPSFRFFRKYRW